MKCLTSTLVLTPAPEIRQRAISSPSKEVPDIRPIIHLLSEAAILYNFSIWVFIVKNYKIG